MQLLPQASARRGPTYALVLRPTTPDTHHHRLTAGVCKWSRSTTRCIVILVVDALRFIRTDLWPKGEDTGRASNPDTLAPHFTIAGSEIADKVYTISFAPRQEVPHNIMATPSSSIDFCTLGMFIIDEIEFPPPKPPVKDIVGGAGSYSALGARIFSPPPLSKSVGWIVDCGSDFPTELRDFIASWNSGVLIRETPDRLTTRGWNGYGENEHRGMSILKKAVPSVLTDDSVPVHNA